MFTNILKCKGVKSYWLKRITMLVLYELITHDSIVQLSKPMALKFHQMHHCIGRNVLYKARFAISTCSTVIGDCGSATYFYIALQNYLKPIKNSFVLYCCSVKLRLWLWCCDQFLETLVNKHVNKGIEKTILHVRKAWFDTQLVNDNNDMQTWRIRLKAENNENI